MLKVLISNYYYCQGAFFRKLFYKYKESHGKKSQTQNSFIEFNPEFSSNLTKSSKEILFKNSLKLAFVHQPYNLLVALKNYHLKIKDTQKNSTPSKEHSKKLKLLSEEKQLLEEINFSKNRFKILYNDLSLEKTLFVDINDLFENPKEKLSEISEFLKIDSTLLKKCYQELCSENPPLLNKVLTKDSYQKSFQSSHYKAFKQNIGPGFLNKYYTQTERKKKEQKKKQKPVKLIKLPDYSELRYCHKNYPSKITIELVDFKNSKLTLQGWFISPYINSYLKISFSNKSSFYIKNFSTEPKVRKTNPEYNQNGKKFSFSRHIEEETNHLNISVMSGENKIHSLSLLRKDKTFSLYKPGHKNLTFLNETKNAPLQERNLLISWPFSNLEEAKSLSSNLFFCFANKSNINDLVLKELASFYRSVFIERSLFLCLDKKNLDAIKELNSIHVISDITKSQKKEERKTNLAFLLSSDTHVTLLKNILKKTKNKLCIAPDLKNKDDGAIRALHEINESYITFSYTQTVCQELSQFNPDYIIALADWTSEYLSLKRFFNNTKTKFVSLQEGPHDWNMQFLRRDGLYVSNQYRNSDVFISQGADPFRHIQPKFFSLAGTPKIQYKKEPLNNDFLVVINCNFTYEKTKPEYESKRDFWLNSILSVCKELNLKYLILKHPRDFSDIDDENQIKTNSSTVKKYLEKSAVVISRFSSICFETMALNRKSIYYNPHYEPMLSFNDKYSDSLSACYNKKDLTNLLQKTYLEFFTKRESYCNKEEDLKCLNFYVNNEKNNSEERIESLLSELGEKKINLEALKDFYRKEFDSGKESKSFSPKKKKYFLIFANNAPKFSTKEEKELYLFSYKLSTEGHKVYYYSNNLPSFYKDLRTLTPIDNFHVIISNDYKNNRPVGKTDHVIASSYFLKERSNLIDSFEKRGILYFNKDINEEKFFQEGELKTPPKNIAQNETPHQQTH